MSARRNTAQMPLPFRGQCRRDLVTLGKKRYQYMSGFNTGGGTFQQFAPFDGGRWITIPHEKFRQFIKDGTLVFDHPKTQAEMQSDDL